MWDPDPSSVDIRPPLHSRSSTFLVNLQFLKHRQRKLTHLMPGRNRVMGPGRGVSQPGIQPSAQSDAGSSKVS